MDRIKNLTPILAFIAVLALLSVGFAVYKAVTAFSGTVESPRYDAGSPIEDIGSVPFKLSRLEGRVQPPRLGDRQMFVVYSGSQEIADIISDGRQATSNLPPVMRRLGMSSSQAQATAAAIARGWPQDSKISENGIDVADNGQDSSWLTVASDYVVLRDSFNYGQDGFLDSAELQISWLVRNGQPVLNGTRIEW